MSFPVPQRDEFPAALPAPIPMAPMHVRTEIPGRGGILAPGAPACHRCGQGATTQWQRRATHDEAGQHWDALEQHIRSQPNLFDSSNAEYVADRSQTVVKAVYGCEQHIVPNPHQTHAAECGGHGACQCEGSATHV